MAQSPVQRRMVSRVSVRPPGGSAPSCLLALYDNADVEIRTAEEDKPLMALLRSAIGTAVEGPERFGRCRKALEEAGYAVLDMPLGDLELKAVFDPQTRRTLGTSRGLHESAGDITDLAASLFNKLPNILANAANDIVARAEKAVANHDHAGAAKTLVEGRGNFLFGITPRALLASRAIDPNELEPGLRAEVLQLRIALAGGLKDFADETGADIQSLKKEFWTSLDVGSQALVLNAEACVAADAGRPEAAFALWRTVTELDGAPANQRGWAYWNLCSLLNGADPELAMYAQLASDAFLEAGDQALAAKAAFRHANCILASSPERALKMVDDAIEWFGGDDPRARDLRAGLFHAKATALLRLGRSTDALACAVTAANLRRDLHGAEVARASSLYLASSAAKSAGLEADAAHYKAEADATKAATVDPEWDLARTAANLALAYEAVEAERVEGEAKRRGDKRTEALLLITRAIHGGEDHVARLALIERAIDMLRAAKAPKDDLHVGKHALADELLRVGERERALPYYLDILSNDPLHPVARQNAASLLWALGRWAEAATFFDGQIKIFGRRPSLLYGYGRSLLESGEFDKAGGYLHEAMTSASATDPVKAEAERYLALAFKRGARSVPSESAPRDPTPVTRQELEGALAKFASFVKADKRMAFWQPAGKGKHKWAQGPERVGQDLLHTFLKGKLDNRIEVFEEIAAGAGRLDIHVHGRGGLSAILELKVLGSPYATGYAFSGADQIAHYMDSKAVRLGFLVIFDGRVRDFGTGLKAVEIVGNCTVQVAFIDVRPEVVSKGSGRSGRPSRGRAGA